MGWASGFHAGTALGKQLVDTYEKAQQQRDFEKISNTKPEEVQGYTAADGQQLEAIANARDANGNPYYSLEAREGGAYGVRPNFQVGGADGKRVDAPTSTVAPRRLTEMFGRRYEGEMSPEQIDAAKSRAFADAVSKYDPIQGLRMRRDIKADERADTEFGWRQEDRPGEQELKGLQISGAKRTERQGVRLEDVQKVYDQASKLTEPELEAMAAKINLGTMPAIYTGRTDKNGFTFVATDKEGRPIKGKEYELNAAQVRQLATSHLLGQAGFGGESFKELTAASKDIAEHIRGHNADFFKNAMLGNDGAYKSGRLNIEGIEANGKLGYYAALRDHYNKPSYLTLTNEKGEAVLVDQNKLRSNPDGTLALPPGTRPPGRPQTSNVDGGIMFVDGKAVGRVDPNTNDISPLGGDIFSGKDGVKRQAELQSKGVHRMMVTNNKNGRYEYAYFNAADPESLFSTPDEALNAGAKPSAAPGKPALPDRKAGDTAPLPPRLGPGVGSQMESSLGTNARYGRASGLPTAADLRARRAAEDLE